MSTRDIIGVQSDAFYRLHLIEIARRLNDLTTPVEDLTAYAHRLADWIEQGPDEEVRYNRYRAVGQAHRNHHALGDRIADHVLISEAELILAVMNGESR